MIENEKISGFKFFSLGLLVFLTLAMDLFVILIDRLIWGRELKVNTFFQNP